MPRCISIAFQSDKSPAEYIRLAKLVNKYDFDTVSVYNDAPFHPSFGPLLLMAPHIKTTRLGPAAVSPFRMHPIDIAANSALLAFVSNAGVYLGLARGAWLDEYGIQEPADPVLGMREAVQVIRLLLSGKSASYKGKVFQLPENTTAPYPLPEGVIPLLIGTWGPKLAALAGEIADEVKIGGSANPGIVPYISKYIRTGEKTANRPSGAVKIVLGAVTVVDEDRQAARQAARKALSLYLPVVARLDPTLEVDPGLLEKIEELGQKRRLDKIPPLISDDLLEKFAFAGDAGDLIRQAEALFDAGAGRVEFGTPHGVPSDKGIQLIGRSVLPALKTGKRD